ncbi:hypothetical protein RND81_01G174000 [Saponaria officinalis]|uniref:Glycosyltransferase n=2 Tax=Saponaria officinalis TaxID=3572 RepID=A0AAW1NF09_SAPOF
MKQIKMSTKLHAICIPYPAQGHITPMLKLATLLHSKGFYITFVNTDYNHRRLARATELESRAQLENFRFETMPDGLPHSDLDVTQDIPMLCHAVMNDFLTPFKKLFCRINDPASGSPPITVIVSDGVLPFAADAARELGGVPLVWLWTASVCGLLGYLQYPFLLNKGIVPFQDSTFLTNGTLDQVIDWIPSMKNMTLKYIPSFIRTTNKDDLMLNYLMLLAQTVTTSSAPIIFNSFDGLEQDVLHDVSKLISGPFYTIGPLQLQLQKISSQHAVQKSLGSNLWKEDSECLNWLDSKNPRSVVYVSFGSITTMTNENLVEFAWALANSTHFFLWVLRPDLVTGETSIIPPEFVSETKDRGLITSWCDQETVLRHPSVGGFLTHCGWNSTLDAVCGGVPVLCWPFFGEQPTNCWFCCRKWGIGMEIESEVKRVKVEMQVREIMDGKKGKEMARNAKKWMNLAEEAVNSSCGSSNLNLELLINDVLLPLKYKYGRN